MSTLRNLRVQVQGDGDGFAQPASMPNHAMRKAEFDEAINALQETSHAPLTKQDSNSIALSLDAQQLTASLRRKTSGLTASQGLLGESTDGVFVVLGSDSGVAAAGDHGHANATETTDGFMSASDKAALNALTNEAGVSTAKVAFTIGDGSTKIFTINHMLNTGDVVVSVRQLDGDKIFLSADIRNIDDNNIYLEFFDAPDSGTMRVTVIG